MKVLVLVVEATASLGASWPVILSKYLQKIIKSFCANKQTMVVDSPDSNAVLFSLVVYHTRGPTNPYLIRHTDWTDDFNRFFRWLSAIDFTAEGCCDAAAITKGLAQVRLACDDPHIQSERLEKHCILVAATASTPDGRRQPSAETVAKKFLDDSISLSIICPTQLQKLKGIYYAGKRCWSSVDHELLLGNLEYTLLVSEDLLDACPILLRQLRIVRNLPIPKGTSNRTASNKDLKLCSLPDLNDPPPSLDKDPLLHCLVPIVITFNNFEKGESSGATQLPKVESSAESELPEVELVNSWDGVLCYVKEGIPIFMTKLEAYRSSTEINMLEHEWPYRMQISSLVYPQDTNISQYSGGFDFVMFKIKDHLDRFHVGNQYWVIHLPSQFLLLYVSSFEPGRLDGMLFGLEMVVFEPPTSSEQQGTEVHQGPTNHNTNSKLIIRSWELVR